MAAPATVTEELSFECHCLKQGGKAKESDETEARKPALEHHPVRPRGVAGRGVFRRDDIERCVFARNSPQVESH